MIHHSAEINEEGVQFLLELSNRPDQLDSDPEVLQGVYNPTDQIYFPGISIPQQSQLDRPFLLPLIGDSDSFSLTVDWPQKLEAPFYKRISYVGILAAESVVRELPTVEQRALGYEDEELDEAFDALSIFGGFFRAAVELKISEISSKLHPTSSADFYMFESDVEFDKIQQILKSGFYTAGEIVTTVRLPELASILEED